MRLVFDLDGTLVDSLPDIRAVASAILAEEGAEPLTRAEAAAFVGDGAPLFVARMCDARGIDAARRTGILARYLAAYDGAVGQSRLYPGVREALDILRQSHRLALCTNKPTAPTRTVLRHFGLDAQFVTVICGDTLKGRHKPDPATLRAALEGLGDAPGNGEGAAKALMIGDSEVDAATAEAAGVPFLLFTEGYRRGEAAAFRKIGMFAAFADLPDLLSRL